MTLFKPSLMHALVAGTLFAAKAFAQVSVEARLEKQQYIEGEPIFVTFEVTNVGGEPVRYNPYGGDVSLRTTDSGLRAQPNMYGCFASLGVMGRSVRWISHRPDLAPGERFLFSRLLRDYDLKAGVYKLDVAGSAGVDWRNGEDEVPGDSFDRRLDLSIARADGEALERIFFPYVNDALSSDHSRAQAAREVIFEHAPSFLESLIARFAFEDDSRVSESAIEALGRIGSDSSRVILRQLFQETMQPFRRSKVVGALALIGHRDDQSLFANVLQEPSIDTGTKSAAAFGLGRIGGDRSVEYLESALPTINAEARGDIATALGITRSRMAIPVLIGMATDPSIDYRHCSALTTLTHKDWCGIDGQDMDRQEIWTRWWRANRNSVQIYGPDQCPEEIDPLLWQQ
jgi:hypothetical protein